MATADISLVIPVHNGERFLAEAVRSAQRQNPPPAEIIVVDDGSTDGTAAVAAALPGVRYVRQEKGGPAAARNHGVRLAGGALLAFLDADDRWTDDKTAIQLALLDRNPDVEIVIGHSQRVILAEWQDGEPVYRSVGEPVFYMHLGSALFRRPGFDRVGWFDERLTMGEDVDWYLRAKELGVRIRFHREVTQYYLKHDANVTLDRAETNRYLVQAFKRSLDRRREGAADQAASLGDWSQESQWLNQASALPAPSVSVIIPAYNAERYVAAAIESVLAQGHPPLELIVVDDGSTDGTAGVVARYPVARYVSQPNAGIGPARNTGIALARGEFLAFLDADDLWAPDKLEWQVAALRADPKLDMVFGFALQFPSPEMAEEIERTIRYVKEPSPAYLAGTMLIRRAAFERAGPFPSHLQLGEFVDWYLRAIDLGLTSAMQPRVSLKRRLHDSNQGIRKRDAQLDYVRIVKATLDRRRRMT